MASSRYRKDKNKKPEAWAAKDPKERYIRLFTSMLFCKEWRSLTARQQMLYVYLQWHRFNAHCYPRGYGKDAFNFNQYFWLTKYKLYTNRSQYYKDMKALIDVGFIDLIENGRITRTKNVYGLSTKWKFNPVIPQKKKSK